jgi:hypothetical protein
MLHRIVPDTQKGRAVNIPFKAGGHISTMGAEMPKVDNGKKLLGRLDHKIPNEQDKK